MPDPPTPDAIKHARQALGLSQPELAHKLMHATPQEIDRLREYQQTLRLVQFWERGTYTPDPDNTTRLIHALTEKE